MKMMSIKWQVIVGILLLITVSCTIAPQKGKVVILTLENNAGVIREANFIILNGEFQEPQSASEDSYTVEVLVGEKVVYGRKFLFYPEFLHSQEIPLPYIEEGQTPTNDDGGALTPNAEGGTFEPDNHEFARSQIGSNGQDSNGATPGQNTGEALSQPLPPPQEGTTDEQTDGQEQNIPEMILPEEEARTATVELMLPYYKSADTIRVLDTLGTEVWKKDVATYIESFEGYSIYYLTAALIVGILIIVVVISTVLTMGMRNNHPPSERLEQEQNESKREDFQKE